MEKLESSLLHEGSLKNDLNNTAKELAKEKKKNKTLTAQVQENATREKSSTNGLDEIKKAQLRVEEKIATERGKLDVQR